MLHFWQNGNICNYKREHSQKYISACDSHAHARIRRVLPVTPTGPVCLSGPPSDTLRWCVNARTTCPDGEVETFGDSAPQDFTTSHEFSAPVEGPPLFFGLTGCLSCHHSGRVPGFCQLSFPKRDARIMARRFRAIFFFYHCPSLCITLPSAAIRAAALRKTAMFTNVVSQ